jgi:hypothetical protein
MSYEHQYGPPGFGPPGLDAANLYENFAGHMYFYRFEMLLELREELPAEDFSMLLSDDVVTNVAAYYRIKTYGYSGNKPCAQQCRHRFNRHEF